MSLLLFIPCNTIKIRKWRNATSVLFLKERISFRMMLEKSNASVIKSFYAISIILLELKSFVIIHNLDFYIFIVEQ